MSAVVLPVPILVHIFTMVLVMILLPVQTEHSSTLPIAHAQHATLPANFVPISLLAKHAQRAFISSIPLAFLSVPMAL